MAEKKVPIGTFYRYDWAKQVQLYVTDAGVFTATLAGKLYAEDTLALLKEKLEDAKIIAKPRAFRVSTLQRGEVVDYIVRAKAKKGKYGWKGDFLADKLNHLGDKVEAVTLSGYEAAYQPLDEVQRAEYARLAKAQQEAQQAVGAFERTLKRVKVQDRWADEEKVLAKAACVGDDVKKETV